MNDIILNVENVSQQFGDSKILHDINIQIARGGFIGLVGASGSGKSTLLKALEGTQPAFQGKVVLDGQEVAEPTRNIGMVHQKYNLYDFLTVESNVAFGLMLDQTHLGQRLFYPRWWYNLRQKHLAQSRDMLAKMKLGHAFTKHPCELSGGMQQRVAIAQSLVMQPKILLLDEPFGALDACTRSDLHRILLTLYQENLEAIKNNEQPPYTIVLVTHELEEAFYCCDRVIALSKNWERGELGSTVVFDKAAPIYHPDDPKDFSRFAPLMRDLKSVIFEDGKNQDRDSHVTYWNEKTYQTGCEKSDIPTYLQNCHSPDQFALITCLDSSPCEKFMPVKDLLAMLDQFCGFDEIYFTNNSKVMHFPEECKCILTSPYCFPTSHEKIQKIMNWMRFNNCTQGIGDGTQLNYIKKRAII